MAGLMLLIITCSFVFSFDASRSKEVRMMLAAVGILIGFVFLQHLSFTTRIQKEPVNIQGSTNIIP